MAVAKRTNTRQRVLIALGLLLLVALAGWLVMSASTELGEAQRARNTSGFNVTDVRQAAKLDFAFMGAYLALFAYLFKLIGWKRPPALAGLLLAVAGTLADAAENFLLFRALDDSEWFGAVRAAGLVKWGLLGTSGLTLVTLALLRSWRDPHPLGRPTDRPPHGEKTWDPPAPGSAPRIGVSLSGGGIRSAAYSLGALQALREKGKLDDAEYLTAVSGGGYLAAGWALSQAESTPGMTPPAWAQGSPEERWFRDNASYLIPDTKGGFAGLARLLAGVLVNVVLVGVLLSAASRPVGWAIHALHEELRAGKPLVIARDDVGAMKVDESSTTLVRIGTVDHGEDEADLTRYELRLAPDPAGNEACFDKAPFDGSKELCVGVAQDPDRPGVVEVQDGKVKVVRQPKAMVVPAPDKPGVKAKVQDQPKVGVADELVVDGQAPRPGQFKMDSQPQVVPLTGLASVTWPEYDSWMWELVGGLLAAAFLAALAVTVLRPRGYTGNVLRNVAKALGGAGLVAFMVIVALPWTVVWLPRTLASSAETTTASAAGSAFYDYMLPGGGLLAVLLAASNQFLAGSKSKEGSGAGASKPFYKKVWERLTKSKKELKWYETSPAKVLVAVASLVAAVVVFVNSLQFAAANGPAGELMGFAFLRNFLPAEAFQPDVVEFALMVAALFAFAWFADAHSWSLFPFYKERLSWAYLLRRVASEPDKAEPLPYHELVPMTRLRDGKGPQFVACCAVNLNETGVVPPGRRAASFTFSSTEIGGPLVGYARPEDYGALSLNRQRDVTLASAMAISGAAFSPAMGKFNLGPVGTVLALANLRLGVWIPNPCLVKRGEGRRMWDWRRLRRPHWVWYLRELTNKYSFNRRYLYVSDGGHWDNLGLVELLRRGCTEIYCVSGAGDGAESFGTVSEAIALAREELGVEITLDPSPLRSPVAAGAADSAKKSKRELRRAGVKDKAATFAAASAVRGTIRYTRCTPPVEGVIYYAEADLTADMPFDVHAFAEAEPDFPDDPTSDQVFNHRQFESYRALGHHQACAAFELTKPPPPDPSCWTKVGTRVKKAVCG